jgi:hypothetical protein
MERFVNALSFNPKALEKMDRAMSEVIKEKFKDLNLGKLENAPFGNLPIVHVIPLMEEVEEMVRPILAKNIP